MPRSTLIDVNPNERFQGLHQNPFMVKLDRCQVNCNTFNDLPNRRCVK